MDEMEDNDAFEGVETQIQSGGLLASIGDIFLEPNKVFRRIDAGLQWWKAFIVLGVIQIIIGWFSLPIQRHILSLNERGINEEQLSRALQNMDKFGPYGLILAPVGILVIYLIYAWIVNTGVNLLSARSDYRKSLSLVTFTGFIAIVEQIISVIIIRSRGIEAIESSEGARISLSLAALFPDLEGFWAAFLESLSVFGIWYYFVLTLGIAAIFRIEIKKSVIPVVILWIITILFLYLSKVLS
ncbi:MAG TPA: YIP1 family protein [Candidatus Krumholzibacteriaceae bacterium]|nr:YIP1 family protein [Candidatus Krumholzibacteriaceae bacterium]